MTAGPSLAATAVDPRIHDLFVGDPSWDLPTVGIELELLPVSTTSRQHPAIAPIAHTRAALDALDAARELVDIGFEPGGQLELHPPPAPTVGEALDRIERGRRAAARRLRLRDLDLVALGVEPWNDAIEVPLQVASPRYRTMDQHYASIGPEGRSFMRQTASTQICIGLRPGPQGCRQWRVANLVAPLLASAFANAPARRGRRLGHNGSRTAIAARADPSRHRLEWTSLPPSAAYERFAIGARPIGHDYVGHAAFGAHLGTLFPPVRPRGTYLEIRSVDALEPDDLAGAVVLTAAILASPWATDSVLTRLPTTAGADRRRWVAAGGPGIRDRWTAREAVELVDIAEQAAMKLLPRDYLPADTPSVLAALRQRIERGEAPGDRLAHRIGIGRSPATPMHPP